MAHIDQPAHGDSRAALGTDSPGQVSHALDSVFPDADPLAGMADGGRHQVPALSRRAGRRMEAWAARYPILRDTPAADNRLSWTSLYWANALPDGPVSVIDDAAAFSMAVFGLDDVMDGAAGAHPYAELEQLSDQCRRIPSVPAQASGAATSVRQQVIAAFEDCYRRLSAYPAYTPVRDFLLLQWCRCHEAMLQEARWRLSLDPVPTMAEYLANGVFSIFVCFVHGALAAMTDLPAPAKEDLGRYEAALRSGALAVRLANDMRTFERESREGTPNAVTLLVNSGEPVRDALLTLRNSLDTALTDLDTQLATLPPSLTRQGTALRRGVRFVCHWYLAHDSHSLSDAQLRRMVSGQRHPHQ